jgi:IS1 family transposase
VAAHASGRRDAALATALVARTHARTGGRPLGWCTDGWEYYRPALTRVYRRPVRTGRPGRPPLRVPPALRLTQTIKHRDRRGRLLRVETRATFGAPIADPTPVHIERLNGVLRDRLACLTRKTHAFAKTAATWDAALALLLFEHNWLRPHPALRRPSATPGRRYDPRTPAMALGLADHPWSWTEFLSTPAPISH